MSYISKVGRILGRTYLHNHIMVIFNNLAIVVFYDSLITLQQVLFTALSIFIPFGIITLAAYPLHSFPSARSL